MASRVERLGRWIAADEVFEAWNSGDLKRMVAARDLRTNPIDRHFLLQSIVKETYSRRSDPTMKQLCIDTGMTHLSEMPAIAVALRKDFGGTLPRVSSFAHLATALAEQGRVDEAVKVCEAAAKLGLHDRSKAGYLGRVGRLAKKLHKRHDA